MTKALSPLQGVRVILIEDDPLVLMILEDMLGELGAVVVASAVDLDGAMRLVEAPTLAIDVALVDLNLAGRTALRVAEVLRRRAVPFALATGYGGGAIPPQWRDRPMLQKPFTTEEVQRVLVCALDGARP